METRSMIELLTILRYEVENRLLTGMCGIINNRRRSDVYLFNYLEQLMLLKYLREHRPIHVTLTHNDYWWRWGEVKLRLEWIDEQLKELKTDNKLPI